MKKQDIYKKIEYYSREISHKKPGWDTVFRIYYDSLKLISEILYHINENPWHPENDYSSDIFESINDKLAKLEELRVKSKDI